MKPPKRYGVPYMGSKNSIAEWITENLPSADTLIDLFAGGWSQAVRGPERGRLLTENCLK